MWFRLALKELRHSRKQMAAVVAILFIGFVGPLVSTSVKSSSDRFLRVKARETLTADLALSSQRVIKEEEVEAARAALAPLRVARATEFVTMASRTAGDGRRTRSEEGFQSTLIQVFAVDENFPIYGRYKVRIGDESSSSAAPGDWRETSELSQDKRAWVFPEVLVQLGASIGDRLRIGEAEFVIVGEIMDGPGALRAGFSFAPGVYIGRQFVASTGLTEFGSQVFHRVYFQLAPQARMDDAGTVLRAALPDPDLFLRTPDDSIQGMERFVQFFGRYLAVVTLVVFALSWMSAFYILEIFLTDRLRQAAILMTLGASRRLVAGVQISQLVAVSLFSLSIGLGVVAGGFALAGRVFGASWPEGFELSIHAPDVGALTLLALLSSLAFSMPLLLKLVRLQPRALLDETSMGADIEPSSRVLRVIFYLPLVALFWGLSVWLMESWKLGTGLMFALLGTSLVGWMAGRSLFRALHGVLRSRQGLVRLAATNLARGRFGTSLCFLALTLVALVLNLVPHLLSSALEELRPRSGRELPALFLFNIPEGTVDSLERFARAKGAELRYLSPLILARLEKVNGQEPKSESFRKFPVRVSFREKLIPSESIIEGEELSGPFDPNTQAEPGISMEIRFAERNGFRIGDLLEFDVQGVPVTGRVQNLRRVKWTDFHPNFFMEFQTGVLDDAPKTFIANVNLSETSLSATSMKARFQYELIREFPDLSVIDIGRTIERIIVIADAMIGPIQAVAWVAVVMSLLILFAVVAHNLRMRTGEMDVLKLLGADAPVIRNLITIEYAAIGLLAALSGGLFALLANHVVSTQVFDIPSRVSWNALSLSFLVIVTVSAVIARVAVNRVLARSTIASRAP